ncbi:MAG: diguanylate cyclase [Candidatus Gastranaerophilales bacterium]|nr:diguanylate cyclase [Candidatus Gastranaerophilales bacterium]
MGILDWISQSTKKLKDVESQISDETKDVYEVYQRNVVLEREIAQRTEELRLANQTLLTLEQVWDMMNSSRPLSSVLETIVSSLYGEFGYIYSFIAQKQYDSTNSCYSLRTYLENDFSTNLSALTNDTVFDFKLYPSENSAIEKAVSKKEITYYISLKQFIEENIPNASEEKIEQIVQASDIKTIIIIPVIVNEQFSGFLSVFSPRKELKDDELSFLNLFARQIELAITIANLFETVKKQAVTDHLTNLFNRRFFEDALHREATRSLRTKQPFCLIGLDLDHLKRINDTYGHSMGDKAIASIAHVITNTSRSVDVPSRYGGEEFFIILPGIDTKGGLIAAERLRSKIENYKVEGLEEGITASLGVASFIEQTTNIDELFEMCDKAMYSSKQKGRNQVTLADTDNVTSWQDIAIDAFVDILTQHRIPFNKNLAQDLIEKLQIKQQDSSGTSTQEMLYSIVDSISQSYFPLYPDGSTKNKVLLATLIAKRMNLSKADVDKLKIATLLYDIGNTLMPKEIMKKAAPLNEKEKDEIQKHPIVGAQEILKPISSISNIIPIIEQHHENWDGSGYPNNKKGDEIPITSQIILIVDSYFAMISFRPYRKAYTIDEAIVEIKNSVNSKYSPELVDAFVHAIEEFKKI